MNNLLTCFKSTVKNDEEELIAGHKSTWKALRKLGFKDASRNGFEVFQRSLECEYDLPDVLRQESVLTHQQHESLWNECPTRNKRITRLMGYLKPQDRSKFLTALRKSNQSHLAKFLEKNGVQPVGEDEKDWPLSDYHTRPLQKIYQYLVNDIHTASMLDLLYQTDCISLVQKESIDRNYRTILEKNRELIDTIMRRSIQQYEQFLSALKEAHPHLEYMLQTFAESKTDIALAQVMFENLAEDFNRKELATRFMEQSKTDIKLKEFLQPLTENGIDILNIEVAGEKLNVIFDTTPEGASKCLKLLIKSNELDSMLGKSFWHLLKYDNDQIFYDACDDVGLSDGASRKNQEICEINNRKADWTGGVVDDGNLSSSMETYHKLNVNAQSHADLVSANVESEHYKPLLKQSRGMKMKQLKVSLKLMEKTEDENSQNQDMLLPGVEAAENNANVLENIGRGGSELQQMETMTAMSIARKRETIALSAQTKEIRQLKEEAANTRKTPEVSAEEATSVKIRNSTDDLNRCSILTVILRSYYTSRQS